MRVSARNHVRKKRVFSGYGLYLGFLGIGFLGILTNHALAQSTGSPLELAEPTPLGAQNPLTESPLRLNSLSPATQSRRNLPAQRVGNVTNSINADDGSGIRTGAFTLRPSLENRIIYRSEKIGTTKQSSVSNQTTISATLQSNWSRHSLSVSGTGSFQKRLSGTLSEDPSANVNADLELNLSELITANIRGGYDFSVEDRTDPNAISNATSQANIHTFSGELALSKNIGIIRGSLTASLAKERHGDITLANNTVVSGKDRDLLDAGLALRIQYAANPVLMPFIEGEIGRTRYDQTIDSNGVKRSFSSYALRLGMEADISDKLNGEFSVGYISNRFEDASLADLNAVSVDTELIWSPSRGTDLNFGLTTTIEPSTSVNVSGAALYALTTGINQQISRNLSANIAANYSLRRFTGSAAPADQTIYGITAGLDWSINRYLSINTDAGITHTKQAGSDTVENAFIGLGLTLTR